MSEQLVLVDKTIALVNCQVDDILDIHYQTYNGWNFQSKVILTKIKQISPSKIQVKVRQKYGRVYKTHKLDLPSTIVVRRYKTA